MVYFRSHSRSNLSAASSYRVPQGEPSRVIQEYFGALDCPRALTCYLLFVNNEHEQLAKLEFDPLHYDNHNDLANSYAATKFLSKYNDLSLSYDVEQVALEKFRSFETLCEQTNRRFKNLGTDPQYKGPVVWLHNAVIRKIASVLGPISPESFFDFANWGPGASTLLKARDACSANKFQIESGITRDLYYFIFGKSQLFRGEYPLWAGDLDQRKTFPNFQVGNKIVTVPKDATTDRVIAIEPGVNLWFQKAIGDMIGRRLLRCGIDLRFQSTNQQLAFASSIDGLNATVDFSSASDSISLELVRELLPPDWFELLDVCRSHFGQLNTSTLVRGSNEPLQWQKFSSMGNGFTFQLESLIFYCTACCVAEYLDVQTVKHGEYISVYGDDVILPCRCLELFSRLTDFYGFRINPKKSYSSSGFRESCGSHFYLGRDVKPIYLKSKLSNIPSVFRLANAIRRLAHRRNANFGCDARFRRVFTSLVSLVPKPLRFRIPETLGDGGFISNFDEAVPTRCKHQIEGFVCKHLGERSLHYAFDGVGLLLDRLWPSSRDPQLEGRTDQPTLSYFVNHIRGGAPKAKGNLVERRNHTRLGFSKSVVHQWYDLGPWW